MRPRGSHVVDDLSGRVVLARRACVCRRETIAAIGDRRGLESPKRASAAVARNPIKFDLDEVRTAVPDTNPPLVALPRSGSRRARTTVSRAREGLRWRAAPTCSSSPTVTGQPVPSPRSSPTPTQSSPSSPLAPATCSPTTSRCRSTTSSQRSRSPSQAPTARSTSAGSTSGGVTRASTGMCSSSWRRSEPRFPTPSSCSSTGMRSAKRPPSRSKSSQGPSPTRIARARQPGITPAGPPSASRSRRSAVKADQRPRQPPIENRFLPAQGLFRAAAGVLQPSGDRALLLALLRVQHQQHTGQ